MKSNVEMNEVWIKKLGQGKYCLEECPSETFGRKVLATALVKWLKVKPEALAEMYLAFHENPKHSRALYSLIKGELMYTE